MTTSITTVTVTIPFPFVGAPTAAPSTLVRGYRDSGAWSGHHHSLEDLEQREMVGNLATGQGRSVALVSSRSQSFMMLISFMETLLGSLCTLTDIS